MRCRPTCGMDSSWSRPTFTCNIRNKDAQNMKIKITIWGENTHTTEFRSAGFTSAPVIDDVTPL